ncbi:MAG: tetratricopeptide repeat protein [Candidatus Kapabacteria bacterium]|nr:tetratricopeptide repeat protein [Candidatus Kapabacteria bacterium]
MAAAKNRQKVDQKRTRTEAADAVVSGAPRWLTPAVLIAILIATLTTYLPVFDDGKEFTNWDDPGYVTEQPLVRSLDKENISRMFDTDTRVAANYHPLTMLSLAIDYDRGQGSIRPFMQTNLVLHLLNTALVFVFILGLFPGNLVMAALVSAFFGLHPMHVESVAWVAERKDVLYTAFFMTSLIFYVRFVRGGSWTWLAGAFLAFVASCYAKPMAVTLPVVLLLIDLFVGRGFGVRSIAEKVPFFIVAVIFGLLTLKAQTSTSEALVDVSYYTFWQRWLIAGYGFLEYHIKLIAPVNLSAFYPYPASNAVLEPIVIVYAAISAALIAACVWFYLKRRSEISKLIFFGVGFFLVTISIVLQIIGVGGAVIADRYTYVPYIGLFIVLGALLQRITRAMPAPYTQLAIVGAASLAFGVLSSSRIGVWQNSGVLWENVISQYSNRPINHAYNNRAVYNLNKGNLEQAERDYAYLESVGTDKSYTYKGYGALLQKLNRHAEAIPRFTEALKLGGEDVEVIRARGLSYIRVGRFDSAVVDLQRTRILAPDDANSAMALLDALLNLNRFRDAINAGAAMAGIAASLPQYHNMMGVAHGQLGEHAQAAESFAKTLQLDPSNETARQNLEIAKSKD